MKSAIAVTRGQLNEGLKLTRQNAEITTKNGSPTARLGAALNAAIIDGFIRDSKEKALADVEEGLKDTPLSSIQALDRPYVGLSQVYAIAGRPDRAREMLAEYEKSTEGIPPDIVAATRHQLLSSIAMAAGSNQFFLAGSYKRLGELWEAKGNRDKAAHYYALFVDLWKNADANLQPRVADVRKRLARLSDTEGKR